MTIKKATDILKKYNEWRRCSEMVNKHKCPPPKQIGEAIEVAVEFMKNASSETLAVVHTRGWRKIDLSLN